MNPYVQNLVNLICGNGGQVDTFVKDVMRSQSIDNDERKQELGNLGPRYQQTKEDDGTTALVSSNMAPVNNNPLYPPNMVDKLNTPFDHVERILLQDFSDEMFNQSENYFRDLFTFTNRTDNTHGITKI